MITNPLEAEAEIVTIDEDQGPLGDIWTQLKDPVQEKLEISTEVLQEEEILKNFTEIIPKTIAIEVKAIIVVKVEITLLQEQRKAMARGSTNTRKKVETVPETNLNANIANT